MQTNPRENRNLPNDGKLFEMNVTWNRVAVHGGHLLARL